MNFLRGLYDKLILEPVSKMAMNTIKNRGLRRMAEHTMAKKVRGLLERYAPEPHDFSTMARLFCDGQVCPAVVDLVVRVVQDANPSICGAIDRNVDAFTEQVDKLPSPYKIFPFFKFKGILTHSFMHSLIEDVVMVANEAAGHDIDDKEAVYKNMLVTTLGKMELTELYSGIFSDMRREIPPSALDNPMGHKLMTDIQTALDEMDPETRDVVRGKLQAVRGIRDRVMCAMGVLITQLNWATGDVTNALRVLDQFDCLLRDLDFEANDD